MDRRSNPYGDDSIPEEIIDAPAEKYAEADARRAGRGREFGTISIADFDEELRTTSVTIDLAGGKIGTMKVSFDPNLVNDALGGQIQDLTDDGDRLAAAEAFCQVVKDWGMYGPLNALVMVFDENDKVVRDESGRPTYERREIVPAGEKVPLQPDIVQYVKTGVVTALWRAINNEVSGGPKRPKGSRNRSGRR